MQKMKNGLMMFCLTVLLSCAALMMNTPTASAMTLADLQGDYRIVGGDGVISETIGSIITLSMENGELIGRVKQPSSSAEYWKPGDVFMKDVFVDNGTVHMKLVTRFGDRFDPSFIRIQSNVRTLNTYWDVLSNTVIYELHKM